MVFFWPFVQAKKYDEYLGQGGEAIGIWTGAACEAFGVKEGTSVRHDQFEALKNNRHAVTGKQLTARHNTIRIEHGRLVGNRRPLYDCTISCPKTFSILFLVAGRNDVLDWHQKAVDKAFAEIESLTSRWDKRGGRKVLCRTGNVCAARYTHFANRSGEPNLHSHIAIINATQSGSKNYAVEEFEWSQRAAYFTSVYRDVLAAEAIKAGYELSYDDFGAPQIAGLEDMIKLYSQRSSDIAEMVEFAEGIVGSTLSDGERKRIGMACRGIDLVAFRTTWQNERDSLSLAYLNDPNAKHARSAFLRRFEAILRDHSDTSVVPQYDWKSLPDPEQLERLNSFALDRPMAPPRCVTINEALDWAILHHYERLSVAKDWQLAAHALRYAAGSNLDLKTLFAAIHEHPNLIARGDGLTTKEHYERECAVIQWVDQGKGRGVKVAKIRDSHLTKHQLDSVNQLLESTDMFSALIGKAGSGKSESLSVLIKANEDAGYKVAAMAPSTRSRDVLQHKDKSTLQRFLTDKKLQNQLMGQDLIVLDEAGFASFKQLKELMEIAVKQRLRIVFSGDPRQHHSVEAGDGFRVMLERSHIKREWLSEILRQGKDAMAGRYRRAAKLLSVGKTTEAFATLDRAGAIHELRGQARIDAMADLFLSERAAGRNVCVVNPSHAENDVVNEAIRERLKAAGALGAERQISVHRSLGFTLAERQDFRNLRPGLLLEITRGPNKGQTYEVRQIDAAKNVCYGVDAKGLRVKFDRHNAETWAVCQRRVIGVSKGDAMVTQCGMKRGKEITNGKRFIVAGFDAAGSIVTTDGDVIQTRNLSFSYAMSSHKSQGETVDTVLFGVSRESVKWVCQKLAYVAATRGRSRIDVFCENKMDLCNIEDRKGDRHSALELIKYCIDLVKKQQHTQKRDISYKA